MRQKEVEVYIDMFERLATPFGLIRSGVAPDHQSVKRITKSYEAAAERENFRFFGNVTLGRDLQADELRAHYDQIIYAVGNEASRRLGVPGEYAEGCAPAMVFVGWYNSHPDYSKAQFLLDREQAVVVGHGNVAGDLSRILLHDPESLVQTDLAEHALKALQKSQVKEVLLLGRGGPAQATFTPKELAELGKIKDLEIIIDPEDMELDPLSEAQLKSSPRHAAHRNMKIFQGYLKRPAPEAPRARLRIGFWRQVREVLQDRQGRIRGLKVEVMEPSLNEEGRVVPKPSGRFEERPTQMMLSAIGFLGRPIQGVPFDERRKLIANVEGRVVSWPEEERLPNEYVVGWAKDGPQGQIGKHRRASAQVVAQMLKDWKAGQVLARELPPMNAIGELLHERNRGQVSFADWKLLDEVETHRGARRNAPRSKMNDTEFMLMLLGKD